MFITNISLSLGHKLLQNYHTFINICCRSYISAKFCTNCVNILSDKAGNNQIKIIWKALFFQNLVEILTFKKGNSERNKIDDFRNLVAK